MASFDPYAPCPCGSGEKFKWCCQKVEAYAEKAIRLFEGGQTDAALAALDDGLSRDPGNVWLTIRKALILGELDRSTEARDLVDAVVQKNPKHLSAQALLIRLRLETEGIKLASDQLQNALTNVASE